MKRLILLLIAFAIVPLTGCDVKKDIQAMQNEYHAQDSGIKSVAWLEGQWASEDSSGKFIEHWASHGEMMHGQGMMIGQSGDTMMMEKLSIVLDSSGLTYIVQFPRRTVNFVSKGQSSTHQHKKTLGVSHSYTEDIAITFANDTNDFPREIIYRRQNIDSLYITLKGSEAGKPIEQVLKMKRI